MFDVRTPSEWLKRTQAVPKRLVRPVVSPIASVWKPHV
jgi:hypothetical protein